MVVRISAPNRISKPQKDLCEKLLLWKRMTLIDFDAFGMNRNREYVSMTRALVRVRYSSALGEYVAVVGSSSFLG